MRTSARLARAAGVVAVLGAATTAGALVEAAAFRVRRRVVALPGAEDGPPLRVLHLSDLHLAPWQRRKQAWLKTLDRLEPDLTVVTGDLLGHRRAVPSVVDALGGLLDRPGVFVLGSNDHVAPRLSNPLTYITGPTSRARDDWDDRELLPTSELVDGLTERGWLAMDNRRATVTAGGRLIDLVGIGDGHHGLDEMPDPAVPAAGSAFRLGVTHAPYRRILEALAGDGAALVLAGHTHGGQVCLPGWGALVTNCDLPTRYADGLFAWPAAPVSDGWERPTSAWVHVSRGVGTSPYTPIRLSCRPEATVLEIGSPVS